MASLIKILDNAKFLSKTVFGDVSAPATPTYAIGRSLSAVNEGSSVTFTLSTTNVANGTLVPYTISGISSSDVTTGSLTGSFTVSNNLATATITMSADQLTEGAETATLTLNNAAASNFVLVNDTSVWTPAVISGLQLWLDAADSSTLFDATAGGNLVTTDGAAVARWADKSGNNRHAIQSTANARPLLKTSVKNGRNILRFDGSNDYLTCGDVCDLGTNSAYIFIVAKNSDSANSAYIVKSTARGLAGRWFLSRFSSDGGLCAAVDVNGANAVVPTVSDSSASDFRVLSNRINRASGTNASSISLAINNSTPITRNFTDPGTNFNNSDHVLIGAYGGSGGSIPPLAGVYLNGDICETAVYIRSTPLTNSEISSILVYLNNKWAIY
jgi:hypothetical protein